MLFRLHKRKIKSFGLTESVVASVIVIVVLSATISLSSNTVKNTEVNASYTEAQHLSENFFESINLIKSSGQVYFDESVRGDKLVDIDCFDTANYQTDPRCALSDTPEYPLDQIPYLKTTYDEDSDEDYLYLVPSGFLDNPAFPDNYFSYNITVTQPENCYTSGGIEIPKAKCRKVLTDIVWEETSGEKHYRQGMYLTDWER